jgi:adenosylmethionine-8-amino-7-oxononanoate aminotransferase
MHNVTPDNRNVLPPSGRLHPDENSGLMLEGDGAEVVDGDGSTLLDSIAGP